MLRFPSASDSGSGLAGTCTVTVTGGTLALTVSPTGTVTLGPAGSLTVHVTHDTILAAFIYHLIGRDHLREQDWPWMLEGAWLWFEEPDTVCWI